MRAGKITAQNILNTLWAFYELRLDVADPHDALMGALELTINTIYPRSVLKALWAIPGLQLQLPHVKDPLLHSFLPIASSLSATHLNQSSAGVHSHVEKI